MPPQRGQSDESPADPPFGISANTAFVSDPAGAGRIILIRKAPDAPGWTPSAHLLRRRHPNDRQTGSKDAAYRMHERQSCRCRLSISLINEP
ncbi:hypothetical protein BOS5A_170040 [Bosea sp. EC-HK365B]|nr:hypothetical protein BOS5A_170040 [Bosea sp. EC-HK365B]